MPLVFGALSLAGCAEGLTRIGRDEKVRSINKWFPREGFAIRPYGSSLQESCFHLRKNVFDGELFDLTSSEEAQIWEHSFKSDMVSAVAKEPFDCVNVLGSIHMAHAATSNRSRSTRCISNIRA